ncbi:MAG TPA: hypothetical protein PLL30_05985 [Candidatus Krumholzibacteria bacterium]|nr:hypothetical protein [Candidatus Krumholzibacteria bacterium]HPD71314.1 hypothetical protein [Candidatus Krumholzibacteria bacterium]HRY38986.1 hypothetical protein [Candidatus Krumholzibacteria bacterium]
MERTTDQPRSGAAGGDAVTPYALLTTLIRRRRLVLILALVGAALAFALTLLRPAAYRASALFQPQASDLQPTGLAQVASRFALGFEPAGGQWGPAVYVELLGTRDVLDPVLLDTLTVGAGGAERVSVLELLGEAAADPAALARGADDLRLLFQAGEIAEIGAVELVVTTAWPDVSHQLAERLIGSLNAFNVSRRRTQAAQEREFVAARVADAHADLQAAEDRLLTFLKQNRSIGESPELTFHRDRLAREIALRQAVYTSLMNDLAQVQIREVRDTPVITLLESPRLPVSPLPRNLALKTVLGLLAGALAGIFLVLATDGWHRAARHATGDAAEFHRAFAAAAPRWRRSR